MMTMFSHSRVRLVGPAVLALATSGCAPAILDPVGPVGAAEKTILLNSVGVMLCVVVPVIIATAVIGWWFRASNRRATYNPGFVYSGKLEVLVWAIPLLVILFLGGIAWIGAHDLDPAKPLKSPAKPLEVDVVSLDWKWLFIYPETGVASVNRLVLPVGRPVHFRLTSSSVMNAFFVPRLGSMIYTMNGMETQLNLQADRQGRFLGQSSQFSGDGFAGMRFETDVVSASEFAAWAARTKASGSVLDRATYTTLAKPAGNVAPHTYGAVAPTLFDDILMRAVDGPSVMPTHRDAPIPASTEKR